MDRTTRWSAVSPCTSMSVSQRRPHASAFSAASACQPRACAVSASLLTAALGSLPSSANAVIWVKV